MHLKEAGDSWMHVPSSQIVWQFASPMISEQFTPVKENNTQAFI